MLLTPSTYITKLSILGAILCIELSLAIPQKWKSFSNSNQGFDWQGKRNGYGSSGRGYSSSDEDAEMIPSTILEEHQVIMV